MTPDVDTRLTTVALALREIVLPAIPSSEVLAREQVDVVLGHLAVFAEQYRHVTDYEAMCLTDMASLGEALVEVAGGSEEVAHAAQKLRAVLEGPSPLQTNSSQSMSRAHQKRNAIGQAVDALLFAGAEGGSPEFKAKAQRLVIEHGKRQSDRDRAWFRSYGMDPSVATLPDIPELFRKANL